MDCLAELNQLAGNDFELALPKLPPILLLRFQHLPLHVNDLLCVNDVHEIVLVVFLYWLLFR